MNITIEDAVKIHARALHHHRGALASLVARDRANELKRVGDVEGCEVWESVACQIELLTSSNRTSDAQAEK